MMALSIRISWTSGDVAARSTGPANRRSARRVVVRERRPATAERLWLVMSGSAGQREVSDDAVR